MVSKIHFFVGTEAELIKVFPVMVALKQSQTVFDIIASGQNDITKSSILDTLNLKADLVLSDEKNIKKSAVGLLQWWFSTYLKAKKQLAQHFGSNKLLGHTMVVHGDTVSTLMGAYIGSFFAMNVAHVEAGLRSHNWLSPFPEEIDRVLASRKATLHFAPGEEACRNLSRAKGNVFNTVFNTIIDSLSFSKEISCKNAAVAKLIKEKQYFVMVLHRQENLANAALIRAMVERLQKQAKKLHGVLVLHKLTEIALEKLGLIEQIQNDTNITVIPRCEYFDFMKLLDGAEFVVTDGGSNQEELAYMGKPCLIMRKFTERNDGLGENALLYGGKIEAIDNFVNSYSQYKRQQIFTEASPSELIAHSLILN